VNQQLRFWALTGDCSCGANRFPNRIGLFPPSVIGHYAAVLGSLSGLRCELDDETQSGTGNEKATNELEGDHLAIWSVSEPAHAGRTSGTSF
jgi:hypothetical protein